MSRSQSNDVPVVPEVFRGRAIRIHGHTLLGDVTVRIGERGR